MQQIMHDEREAINNEIEKTEPNASICEGRKPYPCFSISRNFGPLAFSVNWRTRNMVAKTLAGLLGPTKVKPQSTSVTITLLRSFCIFLAMVLVVMMMDQLIIKELAAIETWRYFMKARSSQRLNIGHVCESVNCSVLCSYLNIGESSDFMLRCQTKLNRYWYEDSNEWSRVQQINGEL